MPNSPRVVLPLLAAGFLIACSPSTESGSTAGGADRCAAGRGAAPSDAGGARRRMAVLWRQPRLATVFAARSDRCEQCGPAQDRVAVQHRQLRPAPRSSQRDDAADDRRCPLHAGRHHAQRRCDRPEERRAAVALAAERRRAALRARAAQNLWPRPRVLDRRRRQRALVHGDAGFLSRRARSRHRPTGAGLRRERHRRSHGRRARRGQRQVEHRQQLAADHRRRRRHRRPRARGRHAAAVEGEFEGRRARLRRPYRQAAVDVPHDSRTAASRATRRGSTVRPKWSATPAFGLR